MTDGDLVSYDLESKKTVGFTGTTYYTDFSGNELVGEYAGATLVPGYFGNGTKLSGYGSYVRATDDAKLNWLDGSFTVAFWSGVQFPPAALQSMNGAENLMSDGNHNGYL